MRKETRKKARAIGLYASLMLAISMSNGLDLFKLNNEKNDSVTN